MTSQSREIIGISLFCLIAFAFSVYAEERRISHLQDLNKALQVQLQSYIQQLRDTSAEWRE